MKRIKNVLLVFCLTIAMLLGSVPDSMAQAMVERGSFDAGLNTVYTPVEASSSKVSGVKNGQSNLDMDLIARYNSGAMSADGGSLEIVEYNKKNGYSYSVSGLKGKLIVSKVSNVVETEGTETGSVEELEGREYDIRNMVSAQDEIPGFAYGDMTSVAVSPDGTKLAAAIQHESYDKAGAVAIFECQEDGSLANPKLVETGVQPDMVTFADDDTVLTADEGEPREGYAAGTVDPKGTVSIIHVKDGTSVQAGFENFSQEDLTKKNIILGVVDGETLAPERDLEPEYIAVTSDGKTAYVSLQEANAIAVLDVASGTFTGIDSAGFEDYSKIKVDLIEDGKYEPAVYENLAGARMPDGISLFEKNGKDYIVTANEGDSREWGDYVNEAKTKAFTGKNIRILDSEKCIGLPEGKSVMFGGRGFTVFEMGESGLKEVYDSGSAFEQITAEAVPDHFNCSNDDIEIDSRSTKKGPEPENVTTGQINGRTYAFIAIERVGGIMAYDITNPEKAQYVNYINSREFDADVKGDTAPEGLCFVSADDSGRPLLLAACEVSGTLASYRLTQKADEGDSVVLYTNDVHNAYERSEDCLGYAAVAQYKKQLEASGYDVELVDIGDALQGGVIGTLSKGSYIKDIMEKTGYSLAVPGNHEFDYGMKNFLDLADDAEYKYVSCNFMDLRTNKTVFEPYYMVEKNGKKTAYIGITTPETFTKSTPTYFQDENGTYIYGFCEGNNGKELYTQVQKTVDEAKAEGADYIVAMGHVGTDSFSSPWTSKEIIANTSGIDVFLDGHSHSTIPSEICQDKDNKDVLLTSTGTKLTALGQLTIHQDGTMESTLIREIDKEDEATLEFVNSVTKKFEGLKNSVVAHSDVNLVVNDIKTGNRLVRSQETNLGDLCADAYREMLGADVAFVNGGGIRANIESGDITYGDIINVHPFGNTACLIEATGQQIRDALEHGSAAAGVGENGGFLQVSGLTYEIDTQIPSHVEKDDKGMFIGVTGEYRVKNIMIGGKPLDVNQTYKLASHNYMLKSSGDGFSMFAGCKILQDEVMIDNQVLINYIVDSLNGEIKADSIYADPYGEGRIKVITDSKEASCEEDGYKDVKKGEETVRETISALGHSWDEGSITIAPTAEAAGQKTYTCSRCHATKTESIPALGNKETVSTSPSASATPSPGTSSLQQGTKKAAATVGKNRKVVVKGISYKVTRAGKSGKAEVQLTRVSSNKKKRIIVPATITIGGVKCKVTGIAKGAFRNCEACKTVIIRSKSLKKISAKAVSGISKKAVIKVPKSRYRTYKKLFAKKTGFKKPMKLKKTA